MSTGPPPSLSNLSSYSIYFSSDGREDKRDTWDIARSSQKQISVLEAWCRAPDQHGYLMVHPDMPLPCAACGSTHTRMLQMSGWVVGTAMCCKLPPHETSCWEVLDTAQLWFSHGGDDDGPAYSPMLMTEYLHEGATPEADPALVE